MPTSKDIKIMSICIMMAEMSNDPVEKQGALISDDDKDILLSTYNKAPIESSYGTDKWEKRDIWHMSAIQNLMNLQFNIKTTSKYNLHIYCTYVPDLEDIKRVYNTGYKKIIYYSPDKSPIEDTAIKEYCNATSVKVEPFSKDLYWSLDKWQAFLE